MEAVAFRAMRRFVGMPPAVAGLDCVVPRLLFIVALGREEDGEPRRLVLLAVASHALPDHTHSTTQNALRFAGRAVRARARWRTTGGRTSGRADSLNTVLRGRSHIDCWGRGVGGPRR